MHYSVLRGLTCNAADLRETHHDLREAFGLVRVLVFSVVLTHVPVALVQLLKLGGVGQASDICSNTNKKTESCGEYRKSREQLGLIIEEVVLLPWLRKLMAFIQAYSSLLIFNWWNLRNRYINLSITSMPSSLKLRNQTQTFQIHWTQSSDI